MHVLSSTSLEELSRWPPIVVEANPPGYGGTAVVDIAWRRTRLPRRVLSAKMDNPAWAEPRHPSESNVVAGQVNGSSLERDRLRRHDRHRRNSWRGKAGRLSAR